MSKLSKLTSLQKAQGSAVAEALLPLRKAIADAQATGTPAEVTTARKRLATAKMVFAENARQANPGAGTGRWGPGATPLIVNSHELPDDRDVRGI